MSEIVSNLNTIKNRITEACEKSGRNSSEVKLLLATKTISADNIKRALGVGEVLIGENKVQELKEKFVALQSIPHQTHFIGHLQSNKIKEVIKYSNCIQSIDRFSLAEKLQKRLDFEDGTMDVFLQVNTSYEQSKYGMEPEKSLAIALQIKQFDRINIKGLMTIGLFSTEAENARKCFCLLKDLQTELLDKNVPVYELSMGMSGDLEVAIEEGATIIRVGTAIFGKRPYPDSYYWNENS